MSYTSGVTNSPLLQTLLARTDGAGSPQTGRTSSAATVSAQDRAQLSPAASALRQASVDDTARAERVKTIQAAVANGTYQVPATDVADKLIKSLTS